MIDEQAPPNNSFPGADDGIDLILFVTDARSGQKLLDRLREIFAARHLGSYHVEVVEVLKMPEKAYEYDVIATPTLIRRRPEPVCRLIGDLTDQERVASVLGVSP